MLQKRTSVVFVEMMTVILWATAMSRYTLKLPRSKGLRSLGENVRSTFLFALPSWQEGAGRLVDFGDSLTQYNVTRSPEDPDARATAQDWLAVGDNLRSVLWMYPIDPRSSE
jgi:hypothetical protein